jgi:hypothetical protein
MDMAGTSFAVMSASFTFMVSHASGLSFLAAGG